jgi:quercetin dioxygenase-like cupin family protein
MMSATQLSDHPLHLGLGATAEIEPLFTGELSWYEDYGRRHSDDGAEGRLVSMYSFTESWDMWEMHPHGSEIVLCISGTMTLIQEKPDGSVSTTRLEPGQYAINEPGTWHTADVENAATALFITAGMGTDHRPRD